MDIFQGPDGWKAFLVLGVAGAVAALVAWFREWIGAKLQPVKDWFVKNGYGRESK